MKRGEKGYYRFYNKKYKRTTIMNKVRAILKLLLFSDGKLGKREMALIRLN